MRCAVFFAVVAMIAGVLAQNNEQSPCVHSWMHTGNGGMSTAADGSLTWTIDNVGPGDSAQLIANENLAGDVQISVTFDTFQGGSNDVLVGAQIIGDDWYSKGAASIRGDNAMVVSATEHTAADGTDTKITPAQKSSLVNAGRWQFVRSSTSLLVRSVTVDTVAEVIVTDGIRSANSKLSFQMVSFRQTDKPTSIRITGMTIKGGGLQSSELLHFRLDAATNVLCSYVANWTPGDATVPTNGNISGDSGDTGGKCVHNWFHSDLSGTSHLTDDGMLVWNAPKLDPDRDARFIGTDVLIGDVRIVVVFDEFTGGSPGTVVSASLVSTDFVESVYAGVSEVAVTTSSIRRNGNPSDNKVASSDNQGFFEFIRTGNTVYVRSQTSDGQRSEQTLENAITTDVAVLAFRMSSFPPTNVPTTIRITGLVIQGGGFVTPELLRWKLSNSVLCSVVDPDQTEAFDDLPVFATPGAETPTNADRWGPDCVHNWGLSSATASVLVTQDGTLTWSANAVGAGDKSRVLSANELVGDFSATFEYSKFRAGAANVVLTLNFASIDLVSAAHVSINGAGEVKVYAQRGGQYEAINPTDTLNVGSAAESGTIYFARAGSTMTVRIGTRNGAVERSFPNLITSRGGLLAWQFSTFDGSVSFNPATVEFDSLKVQGGQFPTSELLAFKMEEGKLCSIVKGKEGIPFVNPIGTNSPPVANQQCLDYLGTNSVNLMPDSNGKLLWNELNGVGSDDTAQKWFEISNIKGDVQISMDYDRFNANGNVAFMMSLRNEFDLSSVADVGVLGNSRVSVALRAFGGSGAAKTKRVFSNSGTLILVREGNSLYVRSESADGNYVDYYVASDTSVQGASVLRFTMSSQPITGQPVNIRIESLRIRGGNFPIDLPLVFRKDITTNRQCVVLANAWTKPTIDVPMPPTDAKCINNWQLDALGLSTYTVSKGALTWTAPNVGSFDMAWHLGSVIISDNSHVVLEWDSFNPGGTSVEIGATLADMMAEGVVELRAAATGNGLMRVYKLNEFGIVQDKKELSGAVQKGRMELIRQQKSIILRVTTIDPITNEPVSVQNSYEDLTSTQYVFAFYMSATPIAQTLTSVRFKNLQFTSGYKTQEQLFFRDAVDGTTQIHTLCSVSEANVNDGTLRPLDYGVLVADVFSVQDGSVPVGSLMVDLIFSQNIRDVILADFAKQTVTSLSAALGLPQNRFKLSNIVVHPVFKSEKMIAKVIFLSATTLDSVAMLISPRDSFNRLVSLLQIKPQTVFAAAMAYDQGSTSTAVSPTLCDNNQLYFVCPDYGSSSDSKTVLIVMLVFLGIFLAIGMVFGYRYTKKHTNFNWSMPGGSANNKDFKKGEHQRIKTEDEGDDGMYFENDGLDDADSDIELGVEDAGEKSDDPDDDDDDDDEDDDEEEDEDESEDPDE